jgi:hypothetical protein|tara:strand:+ start:206 stop:427 length:222 start_codon:yes stop_codon:yes gene_type:complete
MLGHEMAWKQVTGQWAARNRTARDGARPLAVFHEDSDRKLAAESKLLGAMLMTGSGGIVMPASLVNEATVDLK